MAKTTEAMTMAHPYDAKYFEGLNRPGFWGNNSFREAQRMHTLEALCQPRKDDELLELGCGTGRYTRVLADRVRRIVGVDFSAAAIEKALSESTRPNMELRKADIRDLRIFLDRSFDKIVAIDVLEHLSDDDLRAVLAEVKRLMREEALFVFFTPSGSHWIERLKQKGILRQVTGHIRVRTEREYGDILHRQGFRIRDVIRYETCIPLWRLIEGKMKDMPFTGGGVFVSRLGMSVSH
ncbi:MAG TPA: methyltransferase domain-containing protein [Syntrophales bacterium]|nr:methyltransferase domain-containing protein [Syntrophales bacterium]